MHSSNQSCVLVEGPRWGDAEFMGNWMLAVAKVETLWEEALKDSNFERQIDRLLVAYIPHFGISAAIMLSQLGKHHNSSFLVEFDGDEEEFVMMVEMGFFVLTGDRYQMVIPKQINLDQVKRAALKLARTEDDESLLHPEYIVATMPCAEAKEWQTHLRKMGEDRRCTDRLLLLNDGGDSPFAERKTS